jgi:NitT/TauT family transport system substrate-binding protein
MTWNAAVRRELAEKNPEGVRKFLRAILRADSFIREHPGEARAITVNAMGAYSALYEKEWQDFSFSAGLDQGLILNLEDQARWMIKREAGVARRTPNFLEFVHADGLKAVRPEAVRIAGK